MSLSPVSPNAKNYKIGGARFYVRRKDETGYVCLGNAFNIALPQDLQNLDHFTAQSGTRKRDRQEVITESYNITFTLDEFTTQNLNVALRGSDITNRTILGDTEIEVEVEVFVGRSVKIPNQFFILPEGPVQSPLVYNTDTLDIYAEYDPINETGDYIIDHELGIISIPEGSAIADGETITITFDRVGAPGQVKTGKKFNPGTLAGIQEIDGFIFAFVDNKGGMIIWEGVNAVLRTNGDIALTDQDWANVPMTIELIAVNSDTPYGTVSMY